MMIHRLFVRECGRPLAVLVLLAFAACGGDAAEEVTVSGSGPGLTYTLDSPAPTGGEAIRPITIAVPDATLAPLVRVTDGPLFTTTVILTLVGTMVTRFVASVAPPVDEAPDAPTMA